MSRRRRRRSRVVVLDLSILEGKLAQASPIGQAASAAGMSLVSVRAYPCDDGSLTMRAVWRHRQGSVNISMAETIRGLRLDL